MIAALATARPAADILAAHRATAFFLRRLAGLGNGEFDAPADACSPRTRREIIAAIGLDARGYARLAEEIREGAAGPRAFDDAGERAEAVALAATLPPHALRNLVEHSAVHLSVEWRDLPDDLWTRIGLDGSGEFVAVSETPWRRTAELWLAAIDLGSGASFADVPEEVLRRLVRDAVTGIGAAAGTAFDSVDGSGPVRAERAGERVEGALHDVVRWAFGRGDRYLRRL